MTEDKLTDDEARRVSARLNRRALLWSAATVATGLTALVQFNKRAPVLGDSAVRRVFGETHGFNEGVARKLFFSETHRAPEFDESRAIKPRNNYHGTTPEIDPLAWRLNVTGLASGQDISLKLADLSALPTVRQVSELKCVEGWSAIVSWSGIRFRDFLEKYPPAPNATYVAMRSEPEGYDDDFYYVGLDMESCRHPQALLATGRAGAPLEIEHGAPLRLVLPHKYGIKNIKLITHIAYSAERPKDYWADRGYDYYAGL